MFTEFLDGLSALKAWANENEGFVALALGLLAGAGSAVTLLWKVRGNLWRNIRWPLRKLRQSCSYVLNKFRKACPVGLRNLRRLNSRVNFYLLKRGVMTMKVNLNVIPEVSRTWGETYLDGRLAKAGFLTANMVKFLNPADANQQAGRIQQLVAQTPAVKDLLVAKTLDMDIFCALVAEYVIEKSSDYDQGEFSAFPVPYSVVERMIKDLFGEEGVEEVSHVLPIE